MGLNELAQLAESIGIPSLFALLAIYLGFRLINAGYTDHSRLGKSYDALLSENLRKEVHIRDLEKRFTICREALAKAEGATALIEQASNYAVNEYLDDTRQDAMIIERQTSEIGELKTEIATLRAQLAKHNHATIELNEVTESSKELNAKENNE